MKLEDAYVGQEVGIHQGGPNKWEKFHFVKGTIVSIDNDKYGIRKTKKETGMKKVNVSNVTVYDTGNEEGSGAKIIISEFPVFDIEQDLIYVVVGQKLAEMKDKTPISRISVTIRS